MNLKQQLARNYILEEFLRIPARQEALPFNLRHVQPVHIERIQTILAPAIQAERDWLNATFGAENGREIRLSMSSAYRAQAWDIQQGRSGNGEHPKALAFDMFPSNLKDDDMYIKVFYALASRNAQHKGGFAIKQPTFTGGKITSFGFIHLDWGQVGRRWNY
jgi:hypothetical protein